MRLNLLRSQTHDTVGVSTSQHDQLRQIVCNFKNFLHLSNEHINIQTMCNRYFQNLHVVWHPNKCIWKMMYCSYYFVETMPFNSLKISFAIWIIWFGQCVQKAVSQVWPLICRSWRKHEEKSKFSTRFNDCGKFMLFLGPKPNEHWTFTFECTRCSSHWFNWNWHCRKPFCNTIVHVAHSV